MGVSEESLLALTKEMVADSQMRLQALSEEILICKVLFSADMLKPSVFFILCDHHLWLKFAIELFYPFKPKSDDDITNTNR